MERARGSEPNEMDFLPRILLTEHRFDELLAHHPNLWMESPPVPSKQMNFVNHDGSKESLSLAHLERSLHILVLLKELGRAKEEEGPRRIVIEVGDGLD